MHRGHETLFDAAGVKQDLDHGREAVRRATCVAQDGVCRGVVLRTIDAVHKGRHFLLALRRRRNQYALGACFEVLARVFLRREQACRLDDVIHTLRFPWELCRILHRRADGRLAVDDDRLAIRAHIGAKAAMGRVVLQEVREVVRRHEIVHTDDFKAATLSSDAIDETTDAAEAVNCDADCHGVFCAPFRESPGVRSSLRGGGG